MNRVRPRPSARALPCRERRPPKATEEGNWDLVGNNTPVFFVRDPYKFPDFIDTQKRDPGTNPRNPTAMWDFWSQSPESLHQMSPTSIEPIPPTAQGYLDEWGWKWSSSMRRRRCGLDGVTEMRGPPGPRAGAACGIRRSR